MAVDKSEVGRVFEHADVLVERLSAEAPFATPEALLTRARTFLDGMSMSERAAVLSAHPRIGAEYALSADSRREQAGREDEGAMRDLARLNEEYEAKFGFRFVIFVAGRPKSAIIPVMRERLHRTRDQELATAVSELMAIARDRLSRG